MSRKKVTRKKKEVTEVVEPVVTEEPKKDLMEDKEALLELLSTLDGLGVSRRSDLENLIARL